jgi:anti-anti-sigma regulatory factor
MDSTGVGVLVAAHQRAVLAGVRLTIRGVQAGQRRLFELMGLLDDLSVDGDETA